LNSYYPRVGLLTRNIYEDPQNILKNRIKHLIPIVTYLKQQGVILENLLEHIKGNIHVMYNPASFISAFYKDFPAVKSAIPDEYSVESKVEELVDVSLMAKCEEEKRFLAPLEEIKRLSREFLGQIFSQYFLFASLATGDYVKGWSDLDSLAIMKKDAVTNPGVLEEAARGVNKLRSLFYLIFPLQIHGIFILTEEDLQCYPAGFLPPLLLDYSRSFWDKNVTIEFKLRDDTLERLHLVLKETYNFFVLKAEYHRRLFKSRFPSTRDFVIYLHKMLTFPLYFLQGMKQYAYKRESFSLARNYIDSKDMEVIDVASKIRSEWQQKPSLPFLKRLIPLNRRLFAHTLARSYDIKRDTRDLIRKYEFLTRIQPAMEHLCERYIKTLLTTTEREK
jgi:hypothetical protein